LVVSGSVLQAGWRNYVTPRVLRGMLWCHAVQAQAALARDRASFLLSTNVGRSGSFLNREEGGVEPVRKLDSADCCRRGDPWLRRLIDGLALFAWRAAAVVFVARLLYLYFRWLPQFVDGRLSRAVAARSRRNGTCLCLSCVGCRRERDGLRVVLVRDCLHHVPEARARTLRDPGRLFRLDWGVQPDRFPCAAEALLVVRACAAIVPWPCRNAPK